MARRSFGLTIYCSVRKEVKREKKCSIWNEVVERANADFESNRKEFWGFVNKRTKGKKKVIASLRNDRGISLLAHGVNWRY